ncbi:MAG: SBBP repeat-containing protein [Bryobacteraceae bacterium]
MRGPQEIAFDISPYDRRQTLVIDPVLTYSSFLGGSGRDDAAAIALGANGSIYIAGNTTSVNFPVTSAVVQQALSPCTNCSTAENTDIYVAQMNASGTGLVYATYVGGGHTDTALDLALDTSGNVYVTGSTKSSNFPISSAAYRAPSGAMEAFVLKLNPSGNALLYSTMLGPGSGYSLAVGPTGNAYVTGYAAGEFPTTPGAFQSSEGGLGDAFVAQVNGAGSALVYATLLGGPAAEYGRAIALDGAGQVTIAGHVNGSSPGSASFPTTAGAYLGTGQGNVDAFVARFNAAGTALLYSTLLGGTNDEFAYALALDTQSNTYVTGYTSSNDFPTSSGAFRRVHGSGFVSKLNSSGSNLIYSTFIGANVSGSFCGDPAARACGGGFGIAVDASGRALASGAFLGGSEAFPSTSGAIQSSPAGGQDAYLLRLDAAGGSLSYATLLGGPLDDSAQDLLLDAAGDAYIVGTTASSGWPVTSGSFDLSFNGSTDAFVAKINLSSSTCTYTLSQSSVSLAAAAASRSITLTTQAGCSWTAYPQEAYIQQWSTISSTTYGTGSTTITYAIAANPSAVARTATLAIAGKTVTLTQAGIACSYSLSPGSASAGMQGASSTLTVTAPSGCSWTVTSPASWVVIGGGASGSGPGSVSYTVAANTGSARSTSLTAAGSSFSISQSALSCTYSLSATSASYTSAAALRKCRSYSANRMLVDGLECSWLGHDYIRHFRERAGNYKLCGIGQ